MAFYSLKNWKNRDVEFPGRRTLTDVLTSTSQTVDVTRSEGTVTEAGDAFDASTMNDLEGRISSAFLLVDGAKFDNPTNSPNNNDVIKYVGGAPTWAPESGGGDLQESDISWKESGSRLVSGGSVKVNPFEIYNGTLAYQTTATQAGSTTQEGTPTPSNPVDIVGIGTEQADHTWSVTIGGVTASGLAYPLYEGDILDFATGTVYRVNGIYTFDGSEGWEYITSWADDGFRLASTNFTNKVTNAKVGGNYRIPTYKYVGNTYNAWNFITAQGNNVIGTISNLAGIVIRDDNITDTTTFKNSLVGKVLVYDLATPTIERVTITGADAVIRGFIPSARFFQMGRRYFDELPVKNPSESLNTYYEGAAFNSYGNLTSSEEVDNIRVNSISFQYGYEGGAFLTSVSGSIYTDNGNIPVDFTVSDLWGYGANGESELPESGQPVSDYNRFATNSNGFPIELNPVNQASISGLTIGSPVQFRITGTLFFILENVGLKDSGSDSQFYELTTWTDTRDGIHYSNHYPTMNANDTLLLSSITTAINFKFKSVDIDPDDQSDISATVAADGSEVTISSTAATGDYILTIHHESDDHPDTSEQIKITVS